MNRTFPHLSPSQVWGTVYLSEGSEFGSQLQKRHLCSLRRILGVKNSTTNWAVLRERGQEPLQIFWFRASIRLFNSTNIYSDIAV